MLALGRPTVRRAEVLSGCGMTEKRKPVAERQRETMGAGPASNWQPWITGRTRALVARLERVQTRSGEPSRRR